MDLRLLRAGAERHTCLIKGIVRSGAGKNLPPVTPTRERRSGGSRLTHPQALRSTSTTPTTLGLFHVRNDVAHPLPWDLGLLALGAALVVVGLALRRSDGPPAAPHG